LSTWGQSGRKVKRKKGHMTEAKLHMSNVMSFEQEEVDCSQYHHCHVSGVKITIFVVKYDLGHMSKWQLYYIH